MNRPRAIAALVAMLAITAVALSCPIPLLYRPHDADLTLGEWIQLEVIAKQHMITGSLRTRIETEKGITLLVYDGPVEVYSFESYEETDLVCVRLETGESYGWRQEARDGVWTLLSDDLVDLELNR